MQTIGLIGGMSFESSAVYYRLINEMVRERLGGLASAELLMHSVNFDEIVAMQKAGDWDAAATALGDVALQPADCRRRAACSSAPTPCISSPIRSPRASPCR